MFGYIQPLKCELKVREYDYYRAVYCGLCNALKTRCGFKARFIVNYDFSFIALLLSLVSLEKEKIVKRRCIVCPGGRSCVCSNVFDKVADISVILTYMKLQDDIDDKGFLESLFSARFPKLLLAKSYKKAKKAMPEYNSMVIELYGVLQKLEQMQVASLDEPADVFAKMLSAIIEEENSNGRILKQIFYHIGRFVYIIDALDDYEKDIKHKEYNPIAKRYNVFEEKLPDSIAGKVVITLRDSVQAIKNAFDLLDENQNSSLVRNIIELGMNNSIYRVLKKEKK